MKQTLPPTIHFQLTSKCNNNCRHCFGPNKKTSDMSILEINKALKIISSSGAKNIHLTGGEPLFRNNFIKIINLVSKYGLKIILDTNGDYFRRYQKIITEKISIIGLPIDFPNKSFRNKNNLNNVINILQFYKKKHKRPKIRILTTVTKENIDYLENIGLLLKKFRIEVWRIFQFLPLKNTIAEKNKKKLSIPKKEFIIKTNKIKKQFSSLFNVSIVSIGARNHAYFIIGSNGDVMIPTESKKICENKNMGSIFEPNIIKKWHRFGSMKNFQKNSKELKELLNNG